MGLAFEDTDIDCQVPEGRAAATVPGMSTTEASATKTDFVRSQAIAATRSLLAAHGLSLTMDQIADGSSISRRSLFRYFESHDALVRAALEEAITDYEARLTSVAATDGVSTSGCEGHRARPSQPPRRRSRHLAAHQYVRRTTRTRTSRGEQPSPNHAAPAAQQLTDQAWAAAGARASHRSWSAKRWRWPCRATRPNRSWSTSASRSRRSPGSLH